MWDAFQVAGIHAIRVEANRLSSTIHNVRTCTEDTTRRSQVVERHKFHIPVLCSLYSEIRKLYLVNVKVRLRWITSENDSTAHTITVFYLYITATRTRTIINSKIYTVLWRPPVVCRVITARVTKATAQHTPVGAYYVRVSAIYSECLIIIIFSIIICLEEINSLSAASIHVGVVRSRSVHATRHHVKTVHIQRCDARNSYPR